MGAAVNTRDFVIQDQGQLQEWRDMVSRDYVQVECRVGLDIPFYWNAVQTVTDLCHISLISSAPAHYHRSARSIRMDARDDLQVVLLLEGEFSVEQRGRSASLRPGDMTIYDAAMPFVLDCPVPYRGATIKMPKALLASRMPDMLNHTASLIDGSSGVGRIGGDLISSIAAQAPGLDTATLDRMCMPMLDVLSISFGSASERRCHAGDRIQQVKHWIDRNLHDCTLSVASIASANAMSVRTLNRLFATVDETVVRWLHCRRMERAYQLLAEGRAMRVSEAAYQCGFNDLAYFGRCFRATYGSCPSSLKRH